MLYNLTIAAVAMSRHVTVVRKALAATDCRLQNVSLAFLKHIDGLVQNYSNSIANALELLQSRT